MNYGLAEALTGRSDAGDLLLEAEERGLFVTGFDSGGWFEVHSLVREVLLAELERRSPERLREQHARAARWLESMADGMAAIEHWLDAGEPREALRLLAAISMSRFDGGRADAIARIIARIPPEVSGADAASLMQYAWCRLPVDRIGFLDALAAAEAAVADRGHPEEQGRLGILRSMSAWLAGDWQACIDHALAGLEQLGDEALADPIGRFGWSLVAPRGRPRRTLERQRRGRRRRPGSRRQRRRPPARARSGARGGSRPRRTPARLAAGRCRCPPRRRARRDADAPHRARDRRGDRGARAR